MEKEVFQYDESFGKFFQAAFLDKIRIIRFNKEQLLKGTEVEYKEHCSFLPLSHDTKTWMAAFIAMCHIEEDAEYYDHLAEMEKKYD